MQDKKARSDNMVMIQTRTKMLKEKIIRDGMGMERVRREKIYGELVIRKEGIRRTTGCATGIDERALPGNVSPVGICMWLCANSELCLVEHAVFKRSVGTVAITGRQLGAILRIQATCNFSQRCTFSY